VLSFRVRLVPLLLSPCYLMFCPNYGFKCSLSVFLKMVMFQNGFLNESRFCDSLHCMFYFDNLERV
jgi:hypothetical protein